MCGQAGVAGSIDGRSEKVFQRLLIYNSVRGTDSTGAASVKRNLAKGGVIDVTVAKEVGHPFNLLQIRRKDETDFNDVLASTHRALLGHCRSSTRGASTRLNAHPFCFNTIVGTHNGTLGYTSHHKLEGGLKFDTDSEAIFNEIEAHGISETVQKFQGYKDPNSVVTCQDAYALVWYDSKDNTINFLRNRERPLCFAFDKDKKQLFWSSEDVHLMAAMVDVPHEPKFVYYLPMDEHYSWEIPNVGQAFGKARVVRREGHKENPFTYTTSKHGVNTTDNSGGSTWNGDSRFSWPNKKTGFWEKFNSNTKTYKYAEYEHSTYYDSLQEAWDALSETIKFRRVIAKEIPAGVISGYHFDYDKSCHVKTEKPEGSDNSISKVEKEVITDKSAIITLMDERLEKELKKANLNDKKCVQIFKDIRRTAYWDTENKGYILYTFMGFNCDPCWDRQMLKNLPETIPLPLLDIDARHQFKHIGTGKKRVTYYKGYKNEMLVRQTFEKLMETGCCNCNRKPIWGNEVQFLSKDIFVCEFCARDKEQISAWKEVLFEDSKEKGVA